MADAEKAVAGESAWTGTGVRVAAASTECRSERGQAGKDATVLVPMASRSGN